jgi:hypothetical protein
VGDDGAVVLSAGLGEPASSRLPITGHRSYLGWHRERLFKKG